MKLLYITRKYPPAVGGMEKFSYELSQELSKQVPTRIISWGGSQKWLPYFIPKAFIQALLSVPFRKISHIHIGDGLLSPVGLALKIITRRKVTINVMGLDVTYKSFFYQWLVPKCLKRLDKVICISEATRQQCIQRGIPADKCSVIPCAIYPADYKLNVKRADLEKFSGMDLQNKTVLFTVGRLVKRKGVEWFVDNVMPKLGNEYVYLVAGSGPEKEPIEQAIRWNNLGKQVKLLGKISDDDLKLLYNTSDVFVMPNINVPGDMEGFGIVAIEAAAAGLPTVAAATEGIRDAVIEGETGYLFIPSNIKSANIAMKKGLNLKKKNIKESSKQYAWENICQSYIKSFGQINA